VLNTWQFQPTDEPLPSIKPTFFALLRQHIQNESDQELRAASLYLLMQRPELVQSAEAFANGRINSDQFHDCVINARVTTTKRFAVPTEEISALLQKHAAQALAAR
jgi:hypothetical protein